MEWKGVMPAITTCFDANLKVDFPFLAGHCSWLVENGCTGIVPLGSLGEGATLTPDEKLAIVNTCVKAVGSRVPVVAAVSALSTREAVDLARAFADAGCQGLMVLPPYVYLGDWRETRAHVAAVFQATSLPCMLYNNPVAYGVDFLPEQIQELAREHRNLAAVKESSTDVRRVTAIRALLGGSLAVLVGVDDAIVEGVAVGAVSLKKPCSSTAGFFPSSAWIPCPNLCSSSSWCSRRPAWGTPACVPRALSLPAKNCRVPRLLSAACSPTVPPTAALQPGK